MANGHLSNGNICLSDGPPDFLSSCVLLRIPGVWQCSSVFLAAVSIHRLILHELSNVNVSFCSSLRWILSSLNPTTNRSRSMSANVSPYSQSTNSLLKSVTKSATDSPGRCVLLLNRYVWRITDGLGLRWLFTVATTTIHGHDHVIRGFLRLSR